MLVSRGGSVYRQYQTRNVEHVWLYQYIYIYVNIQQYPSISQHQYRCLYSININMCTMFLYINMHFHFKVMSIYKYQHSPRRLWCAYELAAYSRAEEKPLQVMPVTRMHSFMVMSPPK